MVAGIGDVSRFPSSRKLAARTGLTPTVRGPGPEGPARAHPGQGPAWLRRAMNQAAQTARRPPEFAAGYAAIAQRRGKKIATIAVARKLLTRAWHLLSEMQPAQASTPPRRS
jgi:transposase